MPIKKPKYYIGGLKMAKAKSSGGLVSDIKNQVKNSGSNKGKILYFKPGVKMRIRFLQDMDDGMKLMFHDSYALGVNVPCQELFDRNCSHCDNDDLRHRDLYAWSVYDYEANEEKILLGAANNFSPIPALVGMYETYGTLIDRDYVITKNGSQTNTSFSVVPMDKVSFKNKKAKPFSEEKMLSILDKAFPDSESEEDDEDEAPPKKTSKKKAEKKCSDCGKPISKCICDDEEDEEENDYSEMSAKELYQECKSRGLDVKPKKSADYYIEMLEEDDELENEEDEEDEW